MTESGFVLQTQKTSSQLHETSLVQTARVDPKAFGELYQLYVERVFRYLYSRLRNVHDAEDVTAQTFMAAFESLPKLRDDHQFASWLFTIARNKAMDHFRHVKYTDSDLDGTHAHLKYDSLSVVIQSEQSASLAKLIQDLPEQDRELLRLRFLAEMSFPEIGRMLHRKEDTVKKSIYRLLARLHSQLEE
ncbi:MAG: hypothetical protein BGO78_13960 [Chloroflexi bacterium 44-23]|nr:MAG: hypothetical protein BGO78_13960 [Chloroflexi bacterium 44-23]